MSQGEVAFSVITLISICCKLSRCGEVHADVIGVLRITTTTSDKVLLRLEGRLIGPWVSELKKTVIRAEALSLPLEVDVWDLTYADLDGEKALSRLHRKGVRFKGKSPYAEYLFQRLRIPLYSRHAEADDDEAR